MAAASVSIRPSDQLARLPATLPFDEGSPVSERVALSLVEAIEACFLHSDAYQLTLEIDGLD